jgi:hypothetical protein
VVVSANDIVANRGESFIKAVGKISSLFKNNINVLKDLFMLIITKV